ncbi:serine protease/ABC transporter B family protein tagA-like [Lucilia sericata]|uniref:serine protease/ABC transporter B family protein tagA-like n=1 Tax=Lucilia sericata TaxID=13632 RepID=UPI0018A86015|nr:serine protease/ABC transporter B family protein tagA-like [Lucilia sericata]
MMEKNEDSKYWILLCKAELHNTNIVIGAVYGSPSCSEAEFCIIFNDILDINCDIIISGDFNIDWSQNNFYKNKIENIINDNGLNQIVNKYTRVTNRSNTLIDYVLTNSDNVSIENSANNNIADHETLIVNIKTKYDKETHNETKEIFNYKKNLFYSYLSEIIATNLCDDINETASNLDKCFEETVNKFTYRKTITQRSNINNWFNSELKRLKIGKIRKHELAKFQNTNEAWSIYISSRNLYKTKVQSEKKKYINNKITNAKDQKQMSNQLKNLVLRKNQTVIKSVIFNQIEYKENKQIADEFNKYFINSIREIRDSIEIVQYSNSIQPVITNFKFRAINNIELKHIISKINKKTRF